MGPEVTGRVEYFKETSTTKSHVVVDGEKHPAKLTKKSTGVNFADAELDLLAFLYTLVKILYNSGNTRSLPSLVRLIEPVRLEAGDVHTTTIRNENAYYSCISQCISVSEMGEAGEGEAEGQKKEPIFICGDSHSMSPGWRVLEGRKLIPKLVTGLKHWHLR